MDLRDHLFAKAPYLLASNADGAGTNGGGAGATGAGGRAATGIDEGGPEAAEAGAAHGGVPESGFGRLPTPGAAQAERPLVGTLEELGVIDPDVLWSCTTCGACVEQCPVDIEHVDHIVDMRRYQVLVESAFPSEAGVMLRNLENKGNPWGADDPAREEWTADLDFAVRRVEPGEPVPDDVEYLFWVGCAGALEDRAKKTTRAFAELLHAAGVEFAILGDGETCTGDPARRLGNEFVYQMLAQQNVETLNATRREEDRRDLPALLQHAGQRVPADRRRLRGRAPHPAARPARRGGEAHPGHADRPAASPTTTPATWAGTTRSTRAPREVLATVPGLRQQEMHRCKERGFCCGAGGARMWMEENIGKRINVERVDEALSLDPDVVSTACPYCMVMLSDAVTAKQQSGEAREDVEVLDVAQILRRSLVVPGPVAD